MAETTLSLISSKTAHSVLLAVGSTSLVQTLVASEAGGLSAEALMQSIVQIGGPTAIGSLVAHMVPGLKVKTTHDLRLEKLAMRGAVAGGVAVGVLILAGALPPQVDMQLLALAGLVGVGTAIGDIVALDLSAIMGQN